MPELNIYLRGNMRGLYGSGAEILAIRDESPQVKKGEWYRIHAVVADACDGTCGRNLYLTLTDVCGEYSRNTFRANSRSASTRTTTDNK